MLTLMLLRHAKAVAHGRGEDFARQLADKGKADAARLGAHLADEGLVPSLALVSSAARTTQTFETLQGEIATPIPARFERSLYNATAGELGDMLRGIDQGIGRLMIVGHNPGIADAAVILARYGDPAEIETMRRRFPPGALAVLTFEAETWRDAHAAGGHLDLYVLPEDLAAPD